MAPKKGEKKLLSKLKAKKYVNANEEFQPLLKQIFEDNRKKLENGEECLPINVEPSRIICLRRLMGGGDKTAYIRPIKGEYRFLTELRYFMVICNDQWANLTEAQRKMAILHEYCHCWWDQESQEYKTRKHNIEDFTFLLRDSRENLELVEKFEYVSKVYDDDDMDKGV